LHRPGYGQQPAVTSTRPLIAVVDDEEPICKAWARLLNSAGLDVETFTSGHEFLDSLSTQQPDCVVLDLHMPQVDGFVVQARIADLTLSVPVVIVTGHDSPETRDLALAGRPIAYLRKPVNDEALLDAIGLALKGRVDP
jgi:FixJ family two-component response regulator